MIKEYEVQFVYHTTDTAEIKVFASSPEQAREIADVMFKKTYTTKCVLDHIEVRK